ncbi:MAG: hypothetical protein IV090_24515 [Candidatus Sericytochromatia bacterium]|nr:hypothetical protein [Candidatus Sericytochromatia bacterium]
MSLRSELEQYKAAWAQAEKDKQRLRLTIVQMLQYLSGDSFLAQQVASARSVGQKALNTKTQGDY